MPQVLFENVKLNNTISLNNRILMAPLTRCMADDDLVPTDDMVKYYAKRAKAGLIISEATIIRLMGKATRIHQVCLHKHKLQGGKK